nr:uncharacterized protein LOC128779880 [Desmodus rotundus]
MGRGRAGGCSSPSLAATGGRGREAPREEEEEEEEEEEVRSSGARAAAGTLGPESRRVRAPGRLWEVQEPSSSLSLLPPSPLSSPLSPPPPPPSALLGRGSGLSPGGTGLGQRSPPPKEGLRRGPLPGSPRACAGEGLRAAGETAGPRPAASRQLSCNDKAQSPGEAHMEEIQVLAPPPHSHSFMAPLPTTARARSPPVRDPS